MEQSTRQVDHFAIDEGGEVAAASAAKRVSRGIMKALENREIVPGQRLVEGELAERYGVGRNAVREAIQWLAAHGVMDTTRFRSAAIRRLGLDEALEVLDVAEAVLAVMGRAAAVRFAPSQHGDALNMAMAELETANDALLPGAFAQARRHFYRTLINIGGNRELRRLFPSLSLHIVHAQFHQAGIGQQGLEALRAIASAVAANDPVKASASAIGYAGLLRDMIQAVSRDRA